MTNSEMLDVVKRCDLDKLPPRARRKLYTVLLSHAGVQAPVLRALFDAVHQSNGHEPAPLFDLENPPLPAPKLKREWVGRHVRLLRPMQTGAGVMLGAGTVCVVEASHGGCDLRKADVCPHCQCGHTHRIRKVPECDLELLPPPL